MEIKINREIRNYKEEIFFGLDLRQCLCGVCACLSAVGLYFLCSPHLSRELVSWICIGGALPFALLGIVTYQGMTAEQFLLVWIRYMFLVPKRLTFGQTNYFYRALGPVIKKRWKEDAAR